VTFTNLPPSAAWAHRDARRGFETVFFATDGSTHHIGGHTAAVEEGSAWAVRYAIVADELWHTREARIWGRSAHAEREVLLTSDGSGHWQVDGAAVTALDGCLDVDLESSACTNTLVVRRLRLALDAAAEAPAAYVRALDLTVERLEQHYVRVADESNHQRYDYRAPAFDFACRLVYDASGLVLEYPGIATRIL